MGSQPNFFVHTVLLYLHNDNKGILLLRGKQPHHTLSQALTRARGEGKLILVREANVDSIPSHSFGRNKLPQSTAIS